MKNLLLLVLFALLSAVAYSQKGLHLGVKGTPQNTWMFNADDSDDPDFLYVPTFRSSFGASFSYFLSDAVGVGVDILYSMQGQRFEVNEQDIFNKTNYLKIPILFHFHSNDESAALFYLNAGPQFGILTSSSVVVDLPFIGSSELDTTDEYQALNIGAVLGLGVGFNIADFLMLTTGLRFDYAFTDAEDKEAIVFPGSRAPTNNATAGFEIGLRFVMRSN